MKVVGNILPTADRLKEWNLISDNKCYNYQEIETREHVLKAVCQREMLHSLLDSTFGLAKDNMFCRLKDQQLILNELKRNWNLYNSMGIINKEILEILGTMHFDSNKIMKFGEKCFKIGFLLWKRRCRKIMSLSNRDTLDILN